MFTPWPRWTALVLATLWISSPSLAGKLIYVAPAGEDTAAGTIEQPLASISEGLRRADQPGDQVLVRHGTYHEQIVFPHDGQEGRPIVLRNYPGERPILSADELPTDLVAQVLIQDRQHVELRGFTVRGFRSSIRSAAIFVLGSGHQIVITNNRVHDVRATQKYEGDIRGIAAYTTGSRSITDLKIEANELFDVMTGYSEVVVVTGNVQRFEIVGNTAHHNHTNPVFLAAGLQDAQGNGLLTMADGSVVDGAPAGPGRFAYNTIYNNTDPYRGGIGIYLNGAKDIVVEANTLFNNHTGISAMAENRHLVTSGIKLINNVVHDNHGYGIVVGSGGPDGGPLDSGSVRDVSVAHNTLVNNGHSPRWTRGVSFEIGQVDGLSVQANVIVTAVTGPGKGRALSVRRKPSRLTMNRNVWFYPEGPAIFEWLERDAFQGLESFAEFSQQSADGIERAPRFRVAETNDYRLTETSPAIGLGKTGVTRDRLERPRPTQSADAGAFQFEVGRHGDPTPESISE